MTCEEIICQLQSMASEKYKANVVRMGIPAEKSMGVSTAEIRSLAKKLGKSGSLARELWNTGYHEARLLATLVFDKKEMTLDDLDGLMNDVVSWDLCDHLCKNLILKCRDYEELIPRWIVQTHPYKKRAVFTIIAAAVVHKPNLSDDTLDDYLRIIKENSTEESVKKAVSWALREIGKRDFQYNEKALLLAYELKETGNKIQVWIAKDAIKELENVVKAEGRRRLISADTQMGKSAKV